MAECLNHFSPAHLLATLLGHHRDALIQALQALHALSPRPPRCIIPPDT